MLYMVGRRVSLTTTSTYDLGKIPILPSTSCPLSHSSPTLAFNIIRSLALKLNSPSLSAVTRHTVLTHYTNTHTRTRIYKHTHITTHTFSPFQSILIYNKTLGTYSHIVTSQLENLHVYVFHDSWVPLDRTWHITKWQNVHTHIWNCIISYVRCGSLVGFQFGCMLAYMPKIQFLHHFWLNGICTLYLKCKLL